MSTKQALEVVRAHDPARGLEPLPDVERERIRHAILAAPPQADNIAATAKRREIRHRRKLILIAAFIVVLAAGGLGVAASRLFKTSAEQEQGLPGGSAMFIGTHPHCKQVTAREFHCVLTSPPSVEFVEGSYLGTVMQTVDTRKNVDGGCIATSADGLMWDCYLGQAAVDHGILDPGMLGRYQPEPSHG